MIIKNKEKFSRALREARENNNFTQSYCARACDVSVMTWQNWERGNCRPQEKRVDRICEVLSLNSEDFA